MAQDFRFWLFLKIWTIQQQSPNSPCSASQLEAVSFGKDSCFPAHHILHHFLWTYISLLHSFMLLPGSCSFFEFVTLTKYWSTLWSDDHSALWSVRTQSWKNTSWRLTGQCALGWKWLVPCPGHHAFRRPVLVLFQLCCTRGKSDPQSQRDKSS